MTSPRVPVSWGELLDKLSILEIKLERLTDPAARGNVAREHEALHAVAAPVLAEAGSLFDALRSVNRQLWEIEDAIREEEARARFGSEFVALARSVYRTNDERAALKRALNQRLASDLVEEKSYWVPAPRKATA